MNLSSICRLCFSTNSLHPIFMDNNLHEKYSTAVFNATGVEIQINDGLPQQVCIKCLTLINTALKFRKRCKLVEKELLRMKSVYNVTDKHDGNISSTKALIQKAHLTIEFEPVVRIKTEEIDDLTESIEVGTSQRQTFQNEAINTEIDYSIITSVTSHNQIKPSNIDENLNLESTVDKKNCGGMLRVTKIKSEDTDVNKGQLLDYKQIIEACENDFSDNDVNHRNEIKIYFSDNEKSQNMDTKIYLSDNEMSHNSNININLSDNDTQMNDTEITKLPLKTSGRHKKTRRIKTTNSNNKGTMKIKQAENGINTVELPYNCLPILNGSKKRVTCKMCAKNLSIRSIDTHMAKIHPGADERKVKCDLCDTFVLKCKLKFHTKLIHGSGAFKCIHCKSEFQSRTVLVEHIQTCSINKRRRKSYKASREVIECDICHQKMQKASLRMHTANKHAGLRPVCEHCGKSFANKLRLIEHYRAKHDYEKLRCSYCDFTSATTVAIRNHERWHRGEKPYVCETCGSKFHAAYLLAQHRHSHRADKMFKCDLCPSTFKANNSLHVHKQTCHSKTVYSCAICSRTFRCRYYAAKHQRNVHNSTAPPELLRDLTDTQPCVVQN